MNPQLQIAAQPEVRGRTGRLYASLSAIATRLSALRPGFRPFAVRPENSAMQFAARGRLSCLCAPLQPRRSGAERRTMCRTCGLQVRVLSKHVDRELSSAEIQAAVRSLKLAGMRSAALDIPESVMTLRQLNLYLASQACKQNEVQQPSTDVSQMN